MNDEDIPVLEWERRDEFSSIWLKYVMGVNPAVHCIESLVGPRGKPLNPRARGGVLRLAQHKLPLAWYLCGVTHPYRWAGNAHLAFEYAPGEYWEGDAGVPGLRVRLHNSAPIFDWGQDSVPVGVPHREDRKFITCRNWQFAWFLREYRAAPLMVEDNPFRRRARAEKARRPPGLFD